ncbi:MAG: ABC transporter permease [Planctomycetota bacterium]|nr:ABC transporter permease [Planctomycetota bacterium]
MKRLGATILTDVRLQFRNGFYYATIWIVVCSIVFLRWLPEETARFLLPVFIIENVMMNAFYFVGGLLLLERSEGTFIVQSVTPLRDDEYLGSKVMTLTVLSLLESLAIALAVLGFDQSLFAIALGVAIAALLMCMVGVALVVRYDSINEFLMPSVLYTFLLSLPVLGYFGIGDVAWFLPHPIQGPFALMQVDVPFTTGSVVYAIGYPLLWLAPAYLWSRRALRRYRTA